MKNLLKKTIAMTCISFNLLATTNPLLEGVEINLPGSYVYDNTAILEGTETRLSDEQIQELLPWAKNIMHTLKLALEDVQYTSWHRQENVLLNAMIKAVNDSAPNDAELLMRYVLNRGLAAYSIIDQQTSDNAPGVIKRKVWLLTETIKMSFRYFESDEAYYNSVGWGNNTDGGYVTSDKTYSKRNIDFVKFAYEYFTFLNEINLSIVDASAQFHTLRFALGLFHVDLARDQYKDKEKSPLISQINDTLYYRVPEVLKSDREGVELQRILKRVQIDNTTLDNKYFY